MKALYEAELIYGRLMQVSEPHLVARYNKALVAFRLPETTLTSFEIDRTGFSPQIAEEFGDPLYLDPKSVNRRFIILSPLQENLPVVHTNFSNTAKLMHDFYAGNRRAIHALTIRDVVYGEIEDNVDEVKTLEDLLSIEDVTFKVLSAEDVLGKASELRVLVNRLESETDFWRDDKALNHMVDLAKVAGDIRENQMVPSQVVFRHDAYWTSHFGGTYVFLDERSTTIIADEAAPGFRRSRPWQVGYIPLDNKRLVFNFLSETGRLELPRASWVAQSGFLEHRMDMVLMSLIAEAMPEQDLSKIDAIWLQTWKQRNASLLERDGRYMFLINAQRRLKETGRILPRDLPPEYAFLLVRAAPEHKDAWLVNRLIAHFVPEDFVGSYVFAKQDFYAFYNKQKEPYRKHIVERLKSLYLIDKPKLRDQLFGLIDENAPRK